MDRPPPFKRTKCACADCVACCKRQPGPLIPEDVERLRIEGISVEHALVASRGGLYGRMTPDGLELVRVPTITPRKVNGACVFLVAERCVIHHIAPFGCAYFDTHMPKEEASRRSIWMARRQQESSYVAFRESLKEVK